MSSKRGFDLPPLQLPPEEPPAATFVQIVLVGAVLIGLLLLFGCGASFAPQIQQPLAGIYRLAALDYTGFFTCDTIRIITSGERGTIRATVTPATAERGLFDLSGELSAPFTVNGVPQPLPLVLFALPDYGQYRIAADTLWILPPRYRWVGAVPYEHWRDGEISGAVATSCERLMLRWLRENQ